MVLIGVFAEFPESINSLYFGGISLVSEPCGSTCEDLLTRHGANRVVMLDPNVRTSFVRNENSSRALVKHLTALSDIVKFSDQDLELLYGNRSSE